VNREYAKKLLIVLPGQSHPAQFHKRKEETFHVLFGELGLTLDGVVRALVAGDVVTIERGVSHEFRSETGAVIEEISTTHFGDDSFYLDPAITSNVSRKTFVTHWMR
jgi:quercetin dioxygenase-like cupin family protein